MEFQAPDLTDIVSIVGSPLLSECAQLEQLHYRSLLVRIPLILHYWLTLFQFALESHTSRFLS